MTKVVKAKEMLRTLHREIVRTLNEASPNVALPETTYAGVARTAPYLIGNVVDKRTKLSLYILEIGNCYLNNNLTGGNPTGYVRSVPVGTASTDIIGARNEHPENDPSIFSKCTKPDADATNPSVCADFTDTLPGSRSYLTPWGETVADQAAVSANTIDYVPPDETCPDNVVRTCNDGTLSDPQDAIYASCRALEAGRCVTPRHKPPLSMVRPSRPI